MKFIIHRCNQISKLKNTPLNYGVEIDIRTYADKLIIDHEPFVEGDLLEDWLNYYNHSQLILNVKEEGLEAKLIELMQKFNIINYFFLDLSFPSLINNAMAGHKKIAIRFSEYEHVESIALLDGLIEWIWIDSFKTSYEHLKNLTMLNLKSFKLCLVSPELQGRNDEAEVRNLIANVRKLNLNLDAICTKNPSVWINNGFTE